MRIDPPPQPPPAQLPPTQGAPPLVLGVPQAPPLHSPPPDWARAVGLRMNNPMASRAITTSPLLTIGISSVGVCVSKRVYCEERANHAPRPRRGEKAFVLTMITETYTSLRFSPFVYQSVAGAHRLVQPPRHQEVE